MAKVSNEAMGSTRSHYSPAKFAPFACHACGHYSWPHLCDHPNVIADAKEGQQGLKMHKSGKAIVEPGGCCEYERP